MVHLLTWTESDRIGGLRRFAAAITIFNILGHTVFGFEQSWAQPLVALGTGYTLEILLEVIDAWSKGRPPRFRGGGVRMIDFLLSAHISSLAISMLLYANERLMPIVFAVSVAICSKALLRVRMGVKTCHFMNPSNLGITATLLLFHWVGIAPPYHFTENLGDIGDLILPLLIVCSGSFLNFRFTKRVPLLLGWVVGFALQAAVRHLLLDAPLAAALMPMTGVAFVLFTFYMVTDPATTPIDARSQVFFGLAVAASYGVLMVLHIVFGFFFSLTIVCMLRAAFIVVAERAGPGWAWWRREAEQLVPVVGKLAGGVSVVAAVSAGGSEG